MRACKRAFRNNIHKRNHRTSNQRPNNVAATAPTIWPPINSGTLRGEIPAKVSVIARANVTAGLANDVEEVNQYALVMKAATNVGIASGLNLSASDMTKHKAECRDKFAKTLAQCRSHMS